MKDRIKLIRNNEKLTQEEFGEKLDMTRNKVFNLESGRKIIKSDDIEKICSTFNINEEWIISGKGSMYKSSDKNKSISNSMSYMIREKEFNNVVSKLSSLNGDEFKIVSNLINFFSERK